MCLEASPHSSGLRDSDLSASCRSSMRPRNNFAANGSARAKMCRVLQILPKKSHRRRIAHASFLSATGRSAAVEAV